MGRVTTTQASTLPTDRALGDKVSKSQLPFSQCFSGPTFFFALLSYQPDNRYKPNKLKKEAPKSGHNLKIIAHS